MFADFSGGIKAVRPGSSGSMDKDAQASWGMEAHGISEVRLRCLVGKGSPEEKAEWKAHCSGRTSRTPGTLALS